VGREPFGSCRVTEGVPTLRRVEGNPVILPRFGLTRLWRLALRAVCCVCGGVTAAFLVTLIFARPAAAQTTGQPGATGACATGVISAAASSAGSVVSQAASVLPTGGGSASGSAAPATCADPAAAAPVTAAPVTASGSGIIKTVQGAVQATVGTSQPTGQQNQADQPAQPAVGGVVNAVTGTVTQAASGTVGAVTGTVTQAASGTVGTVTGTVTSLTSRALPVVTGTVTGLVKSALPAVTGLTDGLHQTISGLTGTALHAVTGVVGGLTSGIVPAVTHTVTGTIGNLPGGTVPVVVGTPPTGPTSGPPGGPSVGTGGTAGGGPSGVGAAPVAAITSPGASSPGSSSGAFTSGTPSSGASSPAGPGGVGWLPGRTGTGSGRGFPVAPGQPGRNPVPWAPAAPQSWPESVNGSGSGGGPVLAALLTAELLVTAGVLWRRWAASSRPRSAWLRALEVPG
jgi:hypothetical protein